MSDASEVKSVDSFWDSCFKNETEKRKVTKKRFLEVLEFNEFDTEQELADDIGITLIQFKRCCRKWQDDIVKLCLSMAKSNSLSAMKTIIKFAKNGSAGCADKVLQVSEAYRPGIDVNHNHQVTVQVIDVFELPAKQQDRAQIAEPDVVEAVIIKEFPEKESRGGTP